jgi:hypothetical protein
VELDRWRTAWAVMTVVKVERAMGSVTGSTATVAHKTRTFGLVAFPLPLALENKFTSIRRLS